MDKITLGLDIGQHAIKGVRPARVLRGVRMRLGMGLTDFFERAVPRGEGVDPFRPLSDGQLSVLKKLIAEKKIKPSDSIAVSLPGQLISIKEIVLPFTDPQKIKKTIYYEAEGQIPFTLDDVVLDYQILPGKTNTTRLLVFAAPKEILRNYLERLKSIGIDPVAVTADPVALYYAFSKGHSKKRLKEKTKDAIVIDIGATKTVLCGIKSKALHWSRTTPIGGDLFIERLQEEFQISFREAEQLFCNLNQPGDRQERAAAVLEKAMTSWLTEIEASLKLAGLSTATPIHLYGGGRRILATFLKNALQREIIIENELGGRPRAITSCFGQAAGLALLPFDVINFRRREFVHPKEKVDRGRLVGTALIILLLLGLAGTNVYLHSREQERQYDTLKRNLNGAFRAVFPEIRNVVDAVKQAEGAIADIRKRSDILGIGSDSPLLVLKKITDAVPHAVKFYVTEFAIENEKVRIEAQTSSFDSVDQVRAALLKVEGFESVTVSDAKITADPSKIGFRIQVTLDTTKSGR